MRAKFKNLLILTVLVIGIPIQSHGQFQWTTDGIPIVSTTSTRVHHSTIPDGNGGVFIAYEDNPSGDADIYAQWIDGSGNIRWGENGVVITSAGGDQKLPVMAQDGSGGVFIAWQDEVADNIFIQHLDANGSPYWIEGGLVVCSAPGEQSNVQMVPDGNGGVILVWVDKRNGSTSDIYALRMNSTGFPAWTPNGVPVTTAADNQSSHSVIGDNAGGIFVVWQDYRNGYGNIDIFAQRLSSTGNEMWTADGIAVTSAIDNQISPAMDLSGNKVIICWDDSRTGNSDIYVQALDTTNGSSLWTEDGVPVTTADGSQTSSRIIQDGEGGAIITWQDNRNLYDIYAMKMTANGDAQWTSNGIPINESTGYQVSPEIVSDDSGGAIIVWKDFRSGSDYGLYTQHVNPNGSLLYEEDGLAITTSNVDASQDHILITDESGGALSFWQDNRNGKSDIYSQLYNNNLSFVEPISDTIWSGGSSHSIQWTLRTSQTRFHHFTIRASTTPGDDFPLIIAQDVNPIQLTQEWTPDAINSSTAMIKIQAYNSQSIILDEYESDLFTIDSDPPDLFDLLSPSDSAAINSVPSFQWESTTDDLSGFDHFELWIDDTLSVDDLYTATSPPAQPPSDGYHTWYVRALDKADNTTTSSTFSFVSDTTPPESFSLISPAEMDTMHTNRPTFSWHVTNDLTTGFEKYQLYLDELSLVDNLSQQDTVITLDGPLENGVYQWKVRAFDKVGNWLYSNVSHSFVVDCRAPEITSSSTTEATEDIPFSYTATATDPDGDDITITFEEVPTWLTVSEDQITGTPTEGVQDTSFIIEVYDGLYTTTQTVTLTVQAVNDPPAINSSNSTVAVEDITFNYTATATDPENDNVTFSFQQYASWLTPSENQISGSPSEGTPDTSFIVIASDGSLTDTMKVLLTITPVNDPPQITSSSTTMAKEDSQYVYRATASDVDGPRLSIQFAEYPSWLSPAGAEISGIPIDGCQDTTFKVIASDDILSDTLIVTISVEAVNDPPHFAYALPQPVFHDLYVLNWQFDLDDYAIDPDDADTTLTWTHTLLDTHAINVTLDEATHVVRIYGENIQGTFRVAFTVTDPQDESATDTLRASVMITSIEDQKIAMAPDDFILYDNYPNPFNPTTTIRYGIPEPCHVTLSIYNMLGQRIALLVDEKQKAGMYEFLWEANDKSSGIYFYHIQAGGSWQKVRRMILMK